MEHNEQSKQEAGRGPDPVVPVRPVGVIVFAFLAAITAFLAGASILLGFFPPHLLEGAAVAFGLLAFVLAKRAGLR
ncbi:TPA: hypothetical protein ACXNP2_002560 [Stenotrophomonas maltophilia]